MIWNEKKLNYKVVDLDESYDFHISFISIQGNTKNYDLSKTSCPYRRLKWR
jgi:hypothetical protein